MKERKNMTRISARDVRRWMDEHRDFVLVDTLTNDHYTSVHLPNAKNACVFEVTFLDQMKAIVSDKDQAIVVYGSSDKSKDAVTAAEKLVRAGYTKVHTLNGGLAAWREVDYPLEGEQAYASEVPADELRIENGTYRVNTDKSVIEWTGRNPNKKHYGTLKLSKGEITVKDGVIGGSFEIDMESIKNIDLEGDDLEPVLISHLKSDDFFFVKLFPRAFFEIKAATLVNEPTLSSPNFKVKGTLKLRGIRKSITFPATVNPLPDGGAAVEAHFDIDRTRWGAIYGSSRFFEHLGMHLVFDLISVQVHLVVKERQKS